MTHVILFFFISPTLKVKEYTFREINTVCAFHHNEGQLLKERICFSRSNMIKMDNTHYDHVINSNSHLP